MYWPTEPKTVPVTELGWTNAVYLGGGKPLRDPTMVWGTSVELERMDEFLSAQSSQSNMMISMVHVLIMAVSRALVRHPRMNRRVIGRRVFPYKEVGIVIPIRRPSDGVVDVVFFKDVSSLSLKDIASRMWNEARDRAVNVARERQQQKSESRFYNWLRKWIFHWQLELYMRFTNLALWYSNTIRMPTLARWDQEMNGANAFVNFLGFNGAPPMISYKPSSLGTNAFSVSVTMGAPEQKPVVRDGQVVICKVAPLFVRLDHRMVNGHQAAEFIATLRSYLMDPSQLLEAMPEPAVKDLSPAA